MNDSYMIMVHIAKCTPLYKVAEMLSVHYVHRVPTSSCCYLVVAYLL